MIDGILSGIGWFLGWLDSLTGNYMLALFLFAFAIELLLLPFGVKQQKNTIKQASLRPKEMAIRNRYKGLTDKTAQQKMQQELNDMYQENNYSQFSGCLPMLLQLPIIIALYQVVINPLRYVLGVSADAINVMTSYIQNTETLGVTLESSRGTIGLINLITEKGLNFFQGVIDYARPDSLSKITMTGTEVYSEFEAAVAKGLPDFRVFGLNLADTPTLKNPSWLWLIPVLTFLVYFASMKINRKFSYQPAAATDPATAKATGCSNNMMDIMMPAFSVYITFIVPAAIGVYWIFKSIISTLRQIALFKIMPLPQFTEEDYKAAEREYAGKAPKKQKYSLNIEGTKGNPDSIFHQDDEDYVSPEESDAIARRLDEQDPGAGGMIEKAPVKKDDRDNK